ncbi:DUF962 domain-containing protein [Nocardia sp. NPDC049220]|uniref:DUF962 domain-containing protein n=1 Tax=Nocardia sp. NPDC049220 TaxID=3155273 RepID=UPI00340C6791
MTDRTVMSSMYLVHPPLATAPFDEKLEYYRTIHAVPGVRAMHFIGVPMVVASLPLLVARPHAGVPMFVVGWSFNLGGHLLFGKKGPALRYGPVTYQLAGVATWSMEVGEYLARRSQRRATRQSTSAR